MNTIQDKDDFLLSSALIPQAMLLSASAQHSHIVCDLYMALPAVKLVTPYMFLWC